MVRWSTASQARRREDDSLLEQAEDDTMGRQGGRRYVLVMHSFPLHHLGPPCMQPFQGGHTDRQRELSVFALDHHHTDAASSCYSLSLSLSLADDPPTLLIDGIVDGQDDTHVLLSWLEPFCLPPT